jgi:hypothetical protein
MLYLWCGQEGTPNHLLHSGQVGFGTGLQVFVAKVHGG